MRKFIPISLISAFLFVCLILLVSRPIAAQSPPKGPEPTPAPVPVEPVSPAPPPQIDRALLPKIEPQLLKKLLDSGGQPAPFIVYLKAKADLAGVAASSAGIGAPTKADIVARRAAIVNTLQQTARDTQSGVVQFLANPPVEPGLTGQGSPTTDIKSLWIINAVAARGSLNTVLALAARPDVEVVRLDKTFKISLPADKVASILRSAAPLPAPTTTSPLAAALPNLASPEWGISKIRADLVHNALGIDGAGIVVANIDTGVDWFHPALQSNYRGYTGPGKLPQHSGNWFDATGQGATYPVDGGGHGTHTMGTMVGVNDIGVAPGAKWIAVRAFDSTGTAQLSWLHDAFQWILAPNGNPALAPDIVNNSWSSANGFDTEFTPDIQALLNAGIYPVFAAGNNGPGAGTVGSPGSLTTAFAVGATDVNDDIANFSSRGPSPWGQIKPQVSAPGKQVRSSLPGATYGEFSGTSMATPHVAGLAALLLQTSPSLASNPNNLSTVIMSSAVPLGNPIPNNNYGWGRIDAYNAVMSVASFGAMQGAVTQMGGGTIANVTIQITPRAGGPIINVIVDANGAYLQGLATGTYDAIASAFGYEPATAFGIVVMTNTTTTQDFSLTPKPTGTLQGTVRDRATNAPLAAVISLDGTPASATTNPVDGSYSLSLPIGVYTITAIAASHRITKALSVTINDGATVTQNFLLDSAPSILLVDSGRWYQESQISYYQQTLTDLLYPYDVWQIIKPFDTPNDIPPAATLANYDIVIWSSPADSPGYIGADDELELFLAGGGKLLLSGQDIAFFDGGGPFINASPYFNKRLKARYIQDNSGIDTVIGVIDEPFEGLGLTLSGGDGANNQISPDVIVITEADFARPLLFYESDKLAGLHVALCVPYRAIFLPFGFEGINSSSDRSQVMEQTIEWLMEEPDQVGIELSPGSKTLIGNFGTTISHTVRVRNIGASSDIYSLTYSNGTPYNWPLSNFSTSISLGSCQAQEVTIDVQVPVAQTWHISDTFTITAQSNNYPGVADTVTRTTKTPAPVLLVDDDRWYSFVDDFKEALAANNIPYDYWLVPKSWSGPVPPSPPLETLQMYPMTVWYTAYDWFQTLTPTEEDRLSAYLDGGGRLFFSSQDFLYNHLLNHAGKYGSFAQNYLGIQAHIEDEASVSIIGQSGSPVGAHLGPYSLTFPAGYNNFTDALMPTSNAKIATRGHLGQVNGLTNAGVGAGGQHWHTTFLSYGPELLSSAERIRLMQRAMGWLSWLGSSTVTPNVSVSLDTTQITYTAIMTNNGWSDLPTTHFTATFPAQLTPNTASPELTLSGGNFVWSGPLAKNQSKVFTYTAMIASSLPLGTVISQTSWFAYPDHNILFDRVADVRVNFPDLNASTMTVNPAKDVEAQDMLTYTIVLKNDGLVDDPLVTTTNTLPPMLELVSIDPPSQGNIIPNGNSFTWTTSLAKEGGIATLTYRAIISYETSSKVIKNTAYLDDGISQLALSAQATFKLTPIYLPLIQKK
jgi:subtilisin family serine protease